MLQEGKVIVMSTKEQKILVAYFSHKGQNYCKGKIVDLAVGNTERVAKMIAEETNGDLFEIKVYEEYPFSYRDCVSKAKEELRVNSRPDLSTDADISSYDVIFLGYPNWCGTMPMPVWTFLESHDFSGKIICPFCTHEGSGMGRSEGDLKKICPSADIRPGLAIYGSEVQSAGGLIKAFVNF